MKCSKCGCEADTHGKPYELDNGDFLCRDCGDDLSEDYDEGVEDENN